MGAISAHLLWGVRPALSLSSPHRPQSQELFGGNKCTSVTSISWEERSVCWMCPAWISDCSGSAGSFSEAPENGSVHCGPHQCFFSSISWFSSFLCCWEGTSKKPLTQSRITPSPDQSPWLCFCPLKIHVQHSLTQTRSQWEEGQGNSSGCCSAMGCPCNKSRGAAAIDQEVKCLEHREVTENPAETCRGASPDSRAWG